MRTFAGIVCGLVLLLFAAAYAGDPVYFDGEPWTAFSSQTVAADTGYTSSAHRIDKDTIFGVYVKCAGTVSAGLAYQLSPTSTSSDFAYPTGISWVADSITVTTAKFINWEPEVPMEYMRFKLFSMGANSSASCTVKLYEQ